MKTVQITLNGETREVEVDTFVSNEKAGVAHGIKIMVRFPKGQKLHECHNPRVVCSRYGDRWSFSMQTNVSGRGNRNGANGCYPISWAD